MDVCCSWAVSDIFLPSVSIVKGTQSKKTLAVPTIDRLRTVSGWASWKGHRCYDFHRNNVERIEEESLAPVIRICKLDLQLQSFSHQLCIFPLTLSQPWCDFCHLLTWSIQWADQVKPAMNFKSRSYLSSLISQRSALSYYVPPSYDSPIRQPFRSIQPTEYWDYEACHAESRSLVGLQVPLNGGS